MQSDLSIFGNQNILGETKIVNSKKQGSFLEWIIKRLFQSIGAYASNICVISRNQIDVFINIFDVKIICECKQYEKNSKPVKSLIYEWSAKRDEMKCEKALLVLWGYPIIEEDDKKLAVVIWYDKKLEKFLNLLFSDVEQLRKEILLDLGIDTKELKKYKEELQSNLKKIFSGNPSEIWKEDILKCFSDGILLDIFRYRVILNLLRTKYHYIRVTHGMRDGRILRGKEYFEIGSIVDLTQLNVYLAVDETGSKTISLSDYFKNEIEQLKKENPKFSKLF